MAALQHKDLTNVKRETVWRVINHLNIKSIPQSVSLFTIILISISATFIPQTKRKIPRSYVATTYNRCDIIQISNEEAWVII